MGFSVSPQTSNVGRFRSEGFCEPNQNENVGRPDQWGCQLAGVTTCSYLPGNQLTLVDQLAGASQPTSRLMSGEQSQQKKHPAAGESPLEALPEDSAGAAIAGNKKVSVCLCFTRTTIMMNGQL